MSNSQQIEKNLHLFGGGNLITIAEKIAIELGWKVIIRTSKRLENTFTPASKHTKVEVLDDISKIFSPQNRPRPNDIGFSISSPWIFKQEHISAFNGRLFNLHNQALPRFRGGGGRSWNILMGERHGGCTIHEITSVVDVGRICTQSTFEFPSNCRTPSDYDAFIDLNAANVVETWLVGALKHQRYFMETLDSKMSGEYWPRLNTQIHGWIDWNWTLQEIKNFVDAFSYPHTGARTRLNGQDFTILEAEIITAERKFHSFQNGIIISNSDQPFVAHKDGILKLLSYEQKNPQLRIRLGDRLYTPIADIEKSMITRIDYLPDGTVWEKTGD